MNRRIAFLTAVALASLALMLTPTGTLAHAASDPSVVHQVFDSAIIPVLGVAALIAVSIVWWRSQPHREQ